MLPECLALLAMLLLPKARRVKKRRKRIARRSRFKTKDHPFKTYHKRHTPEETAAYAKRCADEKRNNLTEAEKALAAALRAKGVYFKQEYVLHNIVTGAWCYVDFYIPDHKLIMELDGDGHKDQPKYDRTRDIWISEFTGFRVVRHWNDWVFAPNLGPRLQAILDEGGDGVSGS